MSRAEQAAAFCSALLGGPGGDDRLEGLYVTVWTPGDKRTRWRRADQPGAAASLVAELDEDDGSQAVYICTTLHDEEPYECSPGGSGRHKPHDGPCVYRRPHAADSAGLLGLWVEIDIAGPGHESKHLPGSREQAQKIIDAMGLPPTLVVSSGGGLHVWWMLAEPWLTRDAEDPEAERDRMAALERSWVLTAKHRAEVLGRWQVDSVFDLARLLRPAGTTNRKIEGQPRKVEIVHHDPARQYNPSDFEAYLPESSVLEAYGAEIGASAVRVPLSDAERKMLDSVNLHAVWARVNSAEYRSVDFTPDWLADLLELEAENEGGTGKLLRTWQGDRPEFKDDQNRFDAALIRMLADLGATDVEGMIEALMCRRLRLTDIAKSDKINPRKRIDYIARTVARFCAESQRVAQVRDAADDRIATMAATRMDVDPSPEPEPPAVATDDRGLISDPEQASEAFADYAAELVTHTPATEAEHVEAADAKVRAEHTGEQAAPRVAVNEEDDAPQWFVEDRPEIERTCMDLLTDLLIPKVYRQRGVRVWGLESRDYGEQQRGRMVLRLPPDFDWPLRESRPTRYRPGRPLYTEWWNRTLFDRADGFQRSLERDAKIPARDDAPKGDWPELIRSLVPLWRRDTSGSDIGAYAREWLFDYLMVHHGTGEINEVISQGRPWVRRINGWRPSMPPIIFINISEFLDFCRRQPGTLPGREIRNIPNYLSLTRRRPRMESVGVTARPTWHEIDADQFYANEWAAIIEVTRHSYEISAGKRGLRAVDDERFAVSIDPADEREAR